MKFLTIKVAEKKIDFFEGKEPYECLQAAIGLDRMKTDHGTLAPGLGIIVYELGLLEPEHQHFFAVGKQLFEGNALVYRYNQMGETEDVRNADLIVLRTHTTFIEGRETVEQLIQIGDVDRPQSSVNGEVLWKWRA